MRVTDTNSTIAERQRYRVGVALLVAAALGWSLSGALIKSIFADGEGPDGVTIAFYRSLYAGLFLLPFARGKFHTLTGKSHRPFPFSLRPAALCCVLFFTIMTALFVVANTRTEAANVIILQYTSTFWIFLLSPWILRERPGRRDSWILAVAMVGVAVIFAGNMSTEAFGLVTASASGLFFALLTLMIRLMRNANSAAVITLNLLGSAALLFPVVVFTGGFRVTAQEGILLIALGVVQFGFPYYLYTLALTRVPAYHAGLLTLIEPILNPLWTYLAVGEVVSISTVVGGSVIIVALLLFLRQAPRGVSKMVGMDQADSKAAGFDVPVESGDG